MVEPDQGQSPSHRMRKDYRQHRFETDALSVQPKAWDTSHALASATLVAIFFTSPEAMFLSGQLLFDSPQRPTIPASAWSSGRSHTRNIFGRCHGAAKHVSGVSFEPDVLGNLGPAPVSRCPVASCDFLSRRGVGHGKGCCCGATNYPVSTPSDRTPSIPRRSPSNVKKYPCAPRRSAAFFRWVA